MSPVKVGVVGCGTISSIYFQIGPEFKVLDIVACADLFVDKAREQAKKFGIPKACTVDELMADPEIQIVINLTIPAAHAEVGMAALAAGKSVYNEKPLSVTREDGKRMVDLARKNNVRIGGAPDTFLGGGIQTCRKLIDDGVIGEPIAATAFMMGHGHESWHPDPDFYYQPGGGPMFDMGPYYLTALTNLIGPVSRVSGSTRVTFPERKITSEPKKGETITVNVPTHVAGILDFQNGAIGTIITSFDVWAHACPRIEIYGSEGSMSVPDPNSFGGPVKIRKPGDDVWQDVPLTHGYSENSRAVGVADMAYALQSGRPHRASGDLTYHVLDIMHAVHDASSEGRHIDLTSGCERPAALPTGLAPYTLDE
ncbi:MAG: Gfo/Idh/MocA family oxidoreductase [Candidatus Latescibacteria bacterium]|jgi:predicted dehydrogenase|nr:Gfo/Idh/MocA family oxidoreductase [Candidatus Latescibacterota bacterium]